MKTIAELSILLEQKIKDISYPVSPALLYSPIEYIMELKGKRMRPILVLMAHQLFDENLEKAISPALAIEVFHNFTLLHDDIMDKAPLRRGNPTVHEKWNSNVAILSGDAMMIQAYQLLTKVDEKILKEVLLVFSKAATKVCEGQQWDMDFETQNDVELADYMKMIEYKTAVLLAASLKIGAITAGATKEEQNHLYNFGINMGIAFQLKDDLLDAFGNPKTFGKQLGGDIMANKKTYLYLKALEVADDKQFDRITGIYLNEDFPSDEKVELVKSLFEQMEIPKHTENLMLAHQAKAMVHLDAINSDNKAPLLAFTNKLMGRIS
ncbi:MAG: polyprenyl synthetase family protein [Flavobacteriales bacterium]|nr:polyprenyl synthetase family protein [Flavobacteriales bacterium]